MALTEVQIKTFKKFSFLFLSLLLAVYLSFLFAEILAMLVISILVAMIFNPIVDFFEKRGIQRWIAVMFVFTLTSSVVIISVSILVPMIVRQFNTLSTIITEENLKSLLEQSDKTIKTLFPFLSSINIVEKISSFIQTLFFGWINNLSNFFYSLVSIIAILVIVPFMTFFLLKDNVKILRGVINVMPNKYFEVSYWVIKKISNQLTRFVRAWLLDAFFVGLMSGVGLALLGIENSASIGFIAGIGHLIPYFGPIIGGVPAIAISIIQFGDFSMLPKIVLLFILIYSVDNGLIQPNIFSKGTDLHPLVIIILILVGSELLGIFGMLLAVPAATVIKTAAREIYYGYKNYKIIRA